MRLCKIAVGMALTLSSVGVSAGSAAAASASAGLSPTDRILLTDYARDTWRAVAALADRGPLPADTLRRTDGGWVIEGLTSPTNIAAYLWSTVAAEDLRLISPEEAGRRIGQTLSALAQLERSHGFFYNWYDPSNGLPAQTWPGGGKVRPFLSVVDNGWLAAALMVVGNSRNEFRDATDSLLKPMNFGFFYDPYDPKDPVVHPGLLRGGFWPDNGTFAGFHYGALNTEPRIASYIGIARGDLPAEHYYRMFRTNPNPTPLQAAAPGAVKYGGVPVDEGTLNYRGIQFVPTWDGTMFEALMVSLLVPEADWAPRSWGANHPLYVRAQIEYGLEDARLGYWGLSASSSPGGGYVAYGVAALGLRTHSEHATRPREGIVTPHASFLALQFAPSEAISNLRALTDHFPVYTPFGFLDSVDVLSGKVSERVLILDQGMILAALAPILGGDSLRRGFCAGPVEAAIRPLIAQERFDARIDPATRLLSEGGYDDQSFSGNISLHRDEPPALAGHPRLGRGRQHLVEGILTAAGVSAAIACRSRISKGPRPRVVGG